MTVAIPRDAATVVVVRNANAGIEVLLLQRAERGDHNSGAWVFPGGLVDEADREDAPLAFARAALRECFEEAGILVARDQKGNWPAFDPSRRAELAALRPRVAAGEVSIAEVCSRFAVLPAYERLHFIAHWLTPVARAKRFDTRFFVTVVPEDEVALHDAQETLDHIWITPADALSPGHARRLMTPTRSVLESLLPFDSGAALEAWAAQPRTVKQIFPWMGVAAEGVRPVQPDDPAYAEVAKLDPTGRCDAWCELRPGIEVRIGQHVARVVSDDGSNRYLIGDDVNGWREVDADETVFVAEDQIVIAADADSVPAAMRKDAQWLAPKRGFLKRIG